MTDLGFDSELIPNIPDNQPTNQPIYALLKRADIEAWIRGTFDITGESDKSNAHLLHVSCPWETEHTSNSTDKDAAFFIDHGDEKNVQFYCFHAHCVGRTMEDVVESVGADTLKQYIPKNTITPHVNTDDSDIDSLDALLVGSDGDEMIAEGIDTRDFDDDTPVYTASTDSLLDIEIDVNDISSNLSYVDKKLGVMDKLIFLGEDANSNAIYIASQDSPLIIKKVRPSDITEKFLLSIYSNNDAWIADFGIRAGKNYKIDTNAVCEYFFRAAKRRGIFNLDEANGIGLHCDETKEDGKIWLLNTGNGIYSPRDKKVFDYIETDRVFKNRYINCTNTIKLNDEYASTELVIEMENLIKNLTFKTQEYAWLFFSSVIAMQLPGFLTQSPIVILNGKPGSGKTEIVERIAQPFIKSSGGKLVCAPTTAAGIEQSIAGHASIIYDEYEPSSDRNNSIIQNINDMALSSCTGGTKIHKGTLTGHAIKRNLKAGWLFAAVGNNATSEAMKRRTFFILLDGNRRHKDWPEISKKIDKLFTDDNASKCYRYLIDHLDLVNDNINKISYGMSQFISDKNFIQFRLLANVLGVYYTLRNQKKITEETDPYYVTHMLSFINCVLIPEYKDTTDDADEKDNNEFEYESDLQFINNLKTLEFRDKIGTNYQLQDLLIEISERIKNRDNYKEENNLLMSNGIKVLHEQNKIIFCNSHAILNKVMKNHGISGYKQQLQNLSCSTSSPTIRFKGVISRGIELPLDMFVDIDDENDSIEKSKAEILTEDLATII